MTTAICAARESSRELLHEMARVEQKMKALSNPPNGGVTACARYDCPRGVSPSHEPAET